MGNEFRTTLLVSPHLPNRFGTLDKVTLLRGWVQEIVFASRQMFKPSQVTVRLISRVAKHWYGCPKLATSKSPVYSNDRFKAHFFRSARDTLHIVKMMTASIAKRMIDKEESGQSLAPDLIRKRHTFRGVAQSHMVARTFSRGQSQPSMHAIAIDPIFESF
jgi:hypothetical protein